MMPILLTRTSPYVRHITVRTLSWALCVRFLKICFIFCYQTVRQERNYNSESTVSNVCLQVCGTIMLCFVSLHSRFKSNQWWPLSTSKVISMWRRTSRPMSSLPLRVLETCVWASGTSRWCPLKRWRMCWRWLRKWLTLNPSLGFVLREAFIKMTLPRWVHQKTWLYGHKENVS